MPFLTEEIAEKCNLNGADSLISSAWPTEEPKLAAPDAVAEIDWAIRFVSVIRTVRAECNIPPGARLHAHLSGASADTLARLNRNDEPVRRLARLETITTDGAAPAKGAVQAIVDEATIALPIGDVIDLDAEQARLAKEIDKVEKEISDIDKRLGNEKFTARAPAEVVQENRDRRTAFVLQQEKLQGALARLKAL